MSQLGLFDSAAPPRQPVPPTLATGQDKGAIALGASPVDTTPASKLPKASRSHRAGNPNQAIAPVVIEPGGSAPIPPQLQPEKAIAPKASPENEPRITPYGLCKCGETIDIPGTDSDHCPACGWVTHRLGG